ncbi:MAG: UPF0182 family protein, partial [Gemmatimonadaceae bacterium]
MSFPHTGSRPPASGPWANPRTRRLVLALVAALLLLLIAVPWLGSFVTDWLWFNEIHYESVFLTSLVARVVLFAAAGVFAFAFLYGNVAWARRGPTRLPALFVEGGGGTRVDLSGFVPRVLLGGSIVVALMTAAIASAQWMTALMALHGVPVGEADPLFQRDIGFYLFRLPAVSGVLNMLVVLTMLALLAAAAMYATHGAISTPQRRMSVDPWAARHLGALLAFLFVLFAAQLWIADTSALLYSTTGPLVGASYADVHVRLAGIHISAVVAVIAAGLVVFGIVRRQLPWFAFLAVLAYAGVGLVTRGLIPAAEQKFVVAPNELARERVYIQEHITATRRAWRLDSVETRDLEGDVQLTMADVRANGPTIDNVRLWERDLLKQTFGQLQEIRTYYD